MDTPEAPLTAGTDAGAPTTTPVETPSHIDLSADSLVRIPGQEKPVKFGDWHGKFQSDYTKTSQAKAKLERELAVHQARLAERDRLDQLRSTTQQSGPTAAQKSRLSALREAVQGATYLDGASAAEILRNLDEEFQGNQSQWQQTIQQRDQALLFLGQRLQQLEAQTKGLTQQKTASDFDSKIGRWLKEGGYPEEAKDIASEIYLSYTGDDLDAEFPTIFKNRWEQLQGLFKKLEGQRLQQARMNRPGINIPGRGGNSQASKPLDTSRMSPAQITDLLWSSMEGNET